MDILEIPLAPVVDAFVAELVAERGPRSPWTPCREFLLVAAILVELKSQRLLPGPDEVDDDEELVGWEERDLLLGRLLECRAYAAAADAFVALTEQAARSIPREVGLDEGFVVHAPDLLAGVPPEQLAQAYLRATAERPVPRVDLSHVTVDTVTVAEAVDELVRRLPGGGRHVLPGAHRPPAHPHRGHRPLPGPARAVQAGQGRRSGQGRDLRRPPGRLGGRGRRAGRRGRRAGLDDYDG